MEEEEALCPLVNNYEVGRSCHHLAQMSLNQKSVRKYSVCCIIFRWLSSNNIVPKILG